MSKRPEWEEMEAKKKILKEQRQDCIEAQKSNMDRKAELLVLERRMHMELLEKEMEERLEKEINDEVVKNKKQENEKRLAAEMCRLERDGTREQKIREQLRETGEELKILESKLRAAYVTKQLMAQMAEKEAIKTHEKLEKLKIQKMIESEEKCMEEQARLKESSLQTEKLKYREELLNQIKEGNKKVQDAQRDLALEKALLEQSMRKTREEDEREKATRLERLKQVKQEIIEFQRQKELRKLNENKAKEDEERRIKEYAEEKERKEEERINELKAKEANKNRIRDQITLHHLSMLKETKNREDILSELAEEEMRQRDLEKDKEKENAAHKLKEDFMNFSKKHVEEKNIAWKEDFKEQELYRNQLIESLALQEKLDKSSAGNRELKSKQLRESLFNQMKDKHRRQVEDWQRESALDRLREVEERERMKIVEEERLRMLRNHASKLAGYLPRGVLRENDLQSLGPEFSEKFNKNKALNCL